MGVGVEGGGGFTPESDEDASGGDRDWASASLFLDARNHCLVTNMITLSLIRLASVVSWVYLHRFNRIMPKSGRIFSPHFKVPFP